MLYIERNQEGEIVALRQVQTTQANEQASLLDEEVIKFLGKAGEMDALSQLLLLSDTSIIRVLEDLIDLLIRKNVILLTELPMEAQEKIRERKRVRNKMGEEDLMVDDIL